LSPEFAGCNSIRANSVWGSKKPGQKALFLKPPPPPPSLHTVNGARQRDAKHLGAVLFLKNIHFWTEKVKENPGICSSRIPKNVSGELLIQALHATEQLGIWIQVFCLLLLHHSSEIKSHKEVTKQYRNVGFS
jgi:hypothetical protein